MRLPLQSRYPAFLFIMSVVDETSVCIQQDVTMAIQVGACFTLWMLLKRLRAGADRVWDSGLGSAGRLSCDRMTLSLRWEGGASLRDASIASPMGRSSLATSRIDGRFSGSVSSMRPSRTLRETTHCMGIRGGDHRRARRSCGAGTGRTRQWCTLSTAASSRLALAPPS